MKKRSVRKRTFKQHERNKASIKSEGRLPNSRYMGQLNKIWDREAMLLGMNEPEQHDVLVKQVQFIEIVRPAPKPGTGEIPPIPPTLTTPTTLTQSETIDQLADQSIYWR